MDTSLLGTSVTELLLVFIVVFITIYLLYGRYIASNSDRKLPPSPPSLPIVGSLPFLPTTMEGLVKFVISPRNKLGKIFTFHAGSKRVLMLGGRKAIHEALFTKSRDFADRPTFYCDSLTNPRSKGILNSPYTTEFKNHHHLCVSILKQFGFGQRVMETRILMEVEYMISEIRAKRGASFDIRHLTMSCVANVVMNMAFGRRFDHSDPEFQRLVSEINETLSEIPMELDFIPPLRILPYYKRKMNDIFIKVKRSTDFINTMTAASREDKAMSTSFVHYFIDAQGPDYDRERLSLTVRDLVMAGMETTADAIRWAIVLLTNHVSVQERLHAEIDAVVDRHRLPTLDDHVRMPYTEATILEILRYKTPSPFILRHTRQDTEVEGYFVPRNTTVCVNLYSINMDPDNWPQPQQFRPERFLDESGNVVGRDRILPFGLGKRSCLGEQLARQELFLFLVALLQKFYFRPPEELDSIEVQEVWGLTTTPTAYEVRMITRDNA